MATPGRETLTLEALFTLFHRSDTLSRFISLADSQEYLNLVSWIVERNSKEMK